MSAYHPPKPFYALRGWRLQLALWEVRQALKYNFKTWWMNHRPISWSDTLSSYVLMGITVGFLMFMAGLAIFGFMVTDCNL